MIDRDRLNESPSPDTGEQFPVIALPSDPEWVDALNAKLVEYQERVIQRTPENLRGGPEDILKSLIHVDNKYASAIYKERVLRELLTTGRISTFELGRKLNDDYGYLNHRLYDRACGVVNTYTSDFSFLASKLKRS